MRDYCRWNHLFFNNGFTMGVLMKEDYVYVYYVLNKLDEIAQADTDEMMTSLVDFRDELIYNLGVNQRVKQQEETKNV